MQQVPQASLDFYRQQQQIAATTVAAAGKLWDRVGDDFASSWARVKPSLERVVETGRAAAAVSATQYTPALLAETKQVAPASGALNPAAFLSSAPDGRSMSTLLDEAPIKARIAVSRGLGAADALDLAGSWLTGMLLTVMADTRRAVVGADIVQRPAISGYTRMLNPPSCSRCAILAGKWFRWNQGFLRHPRCFPAGVVVSGPQADAASRRWYEGELIILHTASGQRLPVTGNHPILTDHGWVPANLLNEGHSVVRSTLGEGAAPLVVPNEKQSPALIEDVWGSDGMGSLSRVETSPEDFHGDGMHGEVDIVFADRDLRSGLVSASGEPIEHGLLSTGINAAPALVGLGAANQELVSLSGSPHGVMGGGSLGGTLGAGHFAGTNLASIGVTSDWYAELDEAAAEHVAAHAELFAEAVLALTGKVLRRDEVNGQDEVSPRWDAPSVPFLMDTAGEHARRGNDLLHRLTGQVELDRVVNVERVSWSGHVYNLTSSEGWYSANGLIVSNCDCIHVPSASKSFAGESGFFSDPYEYFHSLSKEQQEKVFGRIESRAIRDGADIYRVENTKLRGLATAKGNLRYGTPSRMTVDDIYRTAGHRANAIRMLEREGYILPEGQVPGGAIFGPRREAYTTPISRPLVAGSNRARVLDARTSGVRDPLDRATMTAAERRLFDANYRLNYARATGTVAPSVPNLRGLRPSDSDAFVRPRPVSQSELRAMEEALRLEVAALRDAPESVRHLAALLGIH